MTDGHVDLDSLEMPDQFDNTPDIYGDFAGDLEDGDGIGDQERAIKETAQLVEVKEATAKVYTRKSLGHSAIDIEVVEQLPDRRQPERTTDLATRFGRSALDDEAKVDETPSDKEQERGADQEPDYTSKAGDRNSGQYAPDHHTVAVRNIELLPKEEETRLGTVIQAGAKAQEILDVAAARANGTLDELRKSYVASSFRTEKMLICERDGKKFDTLTDIDLQEAMQSAKSIVQQKIAVADNYFENGTDGKQDATVQKGDRKADPTEARIKLEQAVRDADEAAKTLVEHNLRWARVIANKYREAAYATHLPVDDVVQAANVGIVEAARSFDPERGYAFSTHAELRAKAEIIKLLHNEPRIVRLPRYAEDILAAAARAKKELLARGEIHNEEEIARKADTTTEKLQELRNASRPPVSLDSSVDNSNADLGEVLEENGKIMNLWDEGRAADPVADEVSMRLLSDTLIKMMDEKLSEEEKQVLVLIALEGLTQEVTGEVLNLTRRQVYIRINRAIDKLKYESTGKDKKNFVGSDRQRYGANGRLLLRYLRQFE